jgi:cytoskeletal protein CcmA (bactofilin family)
MGLFSSKKVAEPEQSSASPAVPGVQSSATYLGRGLQIKGNIGGEDSVHIHGDYEGNINMNGRLEIQQEAIVRGQVKAKNIVIKGSVDGDITAGEKLEIIYTARVTGCVTTPVISIQEGAEFQGDVKM